MKKTALFDSHTILGARLVDFGGWKMPVSYSSVLKEHEAVRDSCGVFDVSHMGEFILAGENSENLMQLLTVNDVKNLVVGQGQYTALCLQNGGIVDDLICYKIQEHKYLLCVNAANIEKDFEWIESQRIKHFPDVEFRNESELWSQIAIQGPKSTDILVSALPSQYEHSITSLAYTHITSLTLDQAPFWIARTGYTGEKGYEIYLPHSQVKKLWESLIEKGATPVGLGARDTLRLESCYLLYGNDISTEITPLEAGIGWATKLNKSNFIGQEALRKQKAEGLRRRLRAFVMQEQGIPRHQMSVYQGGKKVGVVTSGSVLPTLGTSGGLCLVDAHIGLDETITIDIRGKQKAAKIVKKPLYSAKVKD